MQPSGLWRINGIDRKMITENQKDMVVTTTDVTLNLLGEMKLFQKAVRRVTNK